MFTDLVGFTSLSQIDEINAFGLLREYRKMVREKVEKHSRREVKTMGDAFLIVFESSMDSVLCAVETQKEAQESESLRKRVKIGIHLGEVYEENGDVHGDSVNVASRLEPLAGGGGICISEQVYHQVKNKLCFSFARVEHSALKNVKDQIEVYFVRGLDTEHRQEVERKEDVIRLAVLPLRNIS